MSSSLCERAGMLDGGGMQQAAKCLEVRRKDSRRRRRGGREAEFHLQPMGGASLAPCCSAVRALGDKRSTAHVQLVEAGVWEAVVVVVGRRAPLGGLSRRLRLVLDRS